MTNLAIEMNKARTISNTNNEKRSTEMYSLIISIPNVEALVSEGREMVKVRV